MTAIGPWFREEGEIETPMAALEEGSSVERFSGRFYHITLSREGNVHLVMEDFQPAMVFEDDKINAGALAGRAPAVWAEDGDGFRSASWGNGVE